MTPRDRALAAIGGQEQVSVPFDLMENLIHPVPEGGLLRHFGLAEGDHEGLLSALGVHTRWGKPAYIGPPLEPAPFSVPSSFPNKIVTRSIWGGWSGANSYTDELIRPLRDVETVADVEAHKWPNPDWFDYGRIGWLEESPEQYAPVAEWAAQRSQYLRIVGGFDPIFSRIMELCGMQRGLLLLAANPPVIHAMVAHIGEYMEQYYRRIAQAGRGHIDAIAMGDDFAGQRGMLLHPRKWREYFLPLWEKLFAIPHQYGMKALLHSCGAVQSVLGDLIDAGLDIFEVVQLSAEGMDPVVLKREFGSHLVFYGTLDVQNILPFGTEERVRSEVRRLIDIFSKGGRFILANSHIVQEDVPAANVLAMFDEARSYRPAWAKGV